MKLNLAICDDEPLFVDEFLQLLRRTDDAAFNELFYEDIPVFESGETLLDFCVPKNDASSTPPANARPHISRHSP